MLSTVQDKRKGLLWIVILLGMFLRFLPALQTDFPINDGGMFLSMIRDLRANGFVLPVVTSYNYSNIPFAYPPFGFYVAAVISSLFPVADIDLLRWLPAAVSAFIVPAFYWLSLRFFDNKTKTMLATVVVAVMPGTFGWLVMGGGLSRSFGILFFLLAVGNVLRLFRDKHTSSLWFSILFCALTLLSHPEVGFQTAGICFLIWLIYSRDQFGIKQVILISLGTALVSAPWWLSVVIHHGVAPFVSAMQTGIHETLVASLFNSFFSLKGDLPFVPVLGLLGLYLTIRRREYLLFGWLFLPFFLDPRNAPAIADYGQTLLAVEALYFLWEKFNQAYAEDVQKKSRTPSPFAAYFIALPFVALGFYFLWISFSTSREFFIISLQEPDREVMEWVRTNMPEDGRFLLMTSGGRVNPMLDSFQEWFPTLAERHSQNTLQGREWTLGADFYGTLLQFIDLQACTNTDCLRTWASSNDIQIEYVMVRSGHVSPDLVDSIQSDEGFTMVYESHTAVIYESIP